LGFTERKSTKKLSLKASPPTLSFFNINPDPNVHMLWREKNKNKNIIGVRDKHENVCFFKCFLFRNVLK
jgi:hypothetical protein